MHAYVKGVPGRTDAQTRRWNETHSSTRAASAEGSCVCEPWNTGVRKRPSAAAERGVASTARAAMEGECAERTAADEFALVKTP